MSGRAWLAVGGAASAGAALAHLVAIARGPAGYRAFGAGERVARAAERGEAWPALVTLCIACVLGGWAAYAWSGAGLIRPLPLLRTGLVAITAVCLLRGAVLFFPGALHRPDLSATFLFWSSAIVLGMGLVYAVGLAKSWADLSGVR